MDSECFQDLIIKVFVFTLTKKKCTKFLNHSDLLKQYELRSDEFFVSVLVPYDSRGSWSGEKITVSEKAKNFELNKEPIASLTRASIRIRKMISFWSHTPETEGALSDVQGCMLSVGLGELHYFVKQHSQFGKIYRVWNCIQKKGRI